MIPVKNINPNSINKLATIYVPVIENNLWNKTPNAAPIIPDPFNVKGELFKLLEKLSNKLLTVCSKTLNTSLLFSLIYPVCASTIIPTAVK